MGYYYYSFHFVMRPDSGAAYNVLAAVAVGDTPSADALALIHPVPRYFLSDVALLLDFEEEPRIGSPIRLAGDSVQHRNRLSIEFCMHDDRFANGGYMFWVWILSLIDPPSSGLPNVVGYEGTYRNDYDMEFTHVSAEGITSRHGTTIDYKSIHETLHDWSEWEGWAL